VRKCDRFFAARDRITRKRRGNKHRSRRERKTAEGMMHVLLDGAVKFFYQNEKIAGLAFDESFEPKDDRAVFYTHEIHSSKTSHQNSYGRFTRSNSHVVRGRG